MRDHFLIKIRIHSKVFIYDLLYFLNLLPSLKVLLNSFILTLNRSKITQSSLRLLLIYSIF